MSDETKLLQGRWKYFILIALIASILSLTLLIIMTKILLSQDAWTATMIQDLSKRVSELEANSDYNLPPPQNTPPSQPQSPTPPKNP